MKRVQKIVILGTFPSLNEIIGLIFHPPKNEVRVTGIKGFFSWINYAKEIYKERKSTLEERVMWAANIANVVKVEEDCSVAFHWFEKDRRRDHDNIASAVKFIFDGLRKCSIFGGDGWKHISGGFAHNFSVDSKNPRIEIYILEGQKISIPFHLLDSQVVNVSKVQELRMKKKADEGQKN